MACEQAGESPVYAKLAGRVGRVDLIHLVYLVNRVNQPNTRDKLNNGFLMPADCFSTLLEDRTTLSLRCKPFSLQLLNKGRAVHIEQLRRLARDSVSLPERADDETVLELLELS